MTTMKLFPPTKCKLTLEEVARFEFDGAHSSTHFLCCLRKSLRSKVAMKVTQSTFLVLENLKLQAVKNKLVCNLHGESKISNLQSVCGEFESAKGRLGANNDTHVFFFRRL
jgi:hypothetical protein